MTQFFQNEKEKKILPFKSGIYNISCKVCVFFPSNKGSDVTKVLLKVPSKSMFLDNN